MPKAGSELDAHTAARLEIGGRVFYGHNGHGIDTTFDKVNAITKTHAEGHVTQRALNAGMKGKAKTADIYVDRELCSSCGRNNGIGSLARELGLESINVHTPSGSCPIRFKSTIPHSCIFTSARIVIARHFYSQA